MYMKYTIYKTTNMVNGKMYIGKHQTENIEDSYYGSGKALKASIKKHGKENFKKEILFVFDTEVEMNQKEVDLITEEFVARTDTYNMGVGGEGGPHFKGKKHSLETRKKIRKANDERDWSCRRGIPAHNKGKKDSEETRKRKSAAAKRKPPMSEAHKRKISESLKRRNSAPVAQQ
jgi:group I intron endonuclease